MILVTGGSGFLGWNLLRTTERSCVGTYHSHEVEVPGTRMLRMDLEDPDSIRRVVSRIEPEAIIHTAGMTDPDACERNPDRASTCNLDGTRVLVEEADRIDARVVFTSTDLVYDGTKANWHESDPTDPQGVYAQTKRDAEEVVLDYDNSVVARVALMYGWSNGVNGSFVDWMVNKFEDGNELPLFTDQYRTPIFVEDAGEVLVGLARDKTIDGILNVGGPERLNRYEFGREFCEILDYPKDLIQPAKMSDLPELSDRPADCSMDISRLKEELDYTPKTVSEGLQSMAQSG